VYKQKNNTGRCRLVLCNIFTILAKLFPELILIK
jgi:hypothetical protein